jgi:predicted permease
MRRSPGVALVIIAMLALGTGGVTAVFNPLYTNLLAPLPFPQPEQLMLIGGDIPLFNGWSNRFEKEEELGRIFSNLTRYSSLTGYPVSIPGMGKGKQVHVVQVQENFFETLGVRPLRGADFKNSEVKSGIVVSHRFWRNELMGAEDAIGKPINVLVFQLPIIGIMPETFDFPSGADIWMHFVTNIGVTELATSDRHFLGRLRRGISPVKAAEELRAIDFKPGIGLGGVPGPLLQSLQTVIRGDRRPILLMLGSSAMLFLLLVCAGVMNLLITRGTRRQSEMAMRLILGATRRNLVFQLLRETLPLVVAGALAGLWLSEVASAWLMAQFPTLKGCEIVIPVKMAFFAALVLVVTVIGGLTPALYATGVDLNTYLKSGSNAKRRFLPFSFSLRELLVGVQLSLALALLTGVGVLVNSMMFHVDIPLRWSSHNMAVVSAAFPGGLEIGLSREAMTRDMMHSQELRQRLNTMSEVAAVGQFSPIPFSVDAAQSFQSGEGAWNARSGDPERVWIQAVKGRANLEGFKMLGLSLIAGRHFTSEEMTNEIDFQIRSQDRDTAIESRVGVVGGVVIVNQALARQFWPEGNAVGKMIYTGFNNAYEVVGVVRDFQQFGDNKSAPPAYYYPPWIEPVFLVKLHSWSLIKDFRQHLSGFNADSVTFNVRSLGEIVAGATTDTRMTIQLLGSFALLGIAVAGLGVYATTSLMAASWTREMGIRKALGAQMRDILRLTLWRGARVILFALPLGLFLAWILSRILARYLFQIKTDDPFVLIVSCAALLVITIVAAFIPALRVTRINPMDALRNE